MPAPEVTVEERTIYALETVVEVPAGEQAVVVKLPKAVPAGKVAVVRIEVRVGVRNAT